jgi:hypothetical protein
MKAVIYHATVNFREFQPGSQNYPDDIYEQLFAGARKNLNEFGIPLIHLTVDGHPGWGNENYFFDGDPQNVVYNREKFFADFLRDKDSTEVYWLTEPDARLMRDFPALPEDCDLSLLRRRDVIAISPWWRLARSTAVPFFDEALQYFDSDKLTWHGDSWAYKRMWENMGQPDIGTEHAYVDYNNMKIELRHYNNYSTPKSSYVRQWKSSHKIKLFKQENEVGDDLTT